VPRFVPYRRRAGALASALLAVVVVIPSVFASAAHAECKEVRWEIRWQPDPFGTSGGSLVRVPVCYGGTPSTKPKEKPAKPKQPTRAQLRALRYRPSEAVSARVRERMIEQLAHGEQAEQIRAQIASGDLMRQFNASIRAQKPGWSTRDVGDMYTMAYIQLWFLANDKHRISTKVDKAVRKELRRQLALDPRFGRAKDATQQETAEWLGSWTVVLVGSFNHLQTLGDPDAAEDFRDRAGDLITEPDLLGVDLEQIRLTRRGIEPRGS
jgi:hypothetical protein